MESKGRAGRIGAAVLGLGIGAAVVTGVATPTALADETTGSTGAASNSGGGTDTQHAGNGDRGDGSAAGPMRAKPNRTAHKSTKKSSSTADQNPSSTPNVSDDSKRTPSVGAKRLRIPAKSERTAEAADPSVPTTPSTPEQSATVAEPATGTTDATAGVPTVTEVTLVPTVENTGPREPHTESIAETTVVQAVTVVAPAANPAGSPVSPAAPVALSQLWTAAATTRRETTSVGGTRANDPGATSIANPAEIPVSPATPDALSQLWAAATRLSPTEWVTSIALDLLFAVSKAVSGPPVLPPGSTVEVGTSSLNITESITVQANWYFPEGDQPPDRLIWLQHGFGATGPMYSYTAAWLAESTHSIVVTPTLSSNWLAPGGNATPATGLLVAELFVGDRAALTASALDAGYAVQYGLDPLLAALPRRFGLVGHSAGGALVSGVPGFLVENGAADDLVGVILLDGTPVGDQLPSTLRALADYEELTSRYIPIRDIGAPPNVFNQAGNAKESLTAARPDHFDGVVLTGGVHSDAMQGGNSLVQFALYLLAGFPEAQNQAAIQTLMADWFNDWFDGDLTAGDGLAPGTELQIDTAKGVATGTVIGTSSSVTI
jgi:hypothetical protein